MAEPPKPPLTLADARTHADHATDTTRTMDSNQHSRPPTLAAFLDAALLLLDDSEDATFGPVSGELLQRGPLS